MGCVCGQPKRPKPIPQTTPTPSGPSTKLFLPSVSRREFEQALDPEEKRDLKRLLLWFDLLVDGEFEVVCSRDRESFAALVLDHGVPDRFTWLVWRALSGWRNVFQEGRWRELSEEGLAEKKLGAKVRESISKDLERTFPRRAFFANTSEGAVGRRRLQKLLQAYCIAYPRVGYCQGMNFLAAFLIELSADHAKRHHRELTKLDPEEDSFWVFLQMMTEYRMWLFFAGKLPMLSMFLFQYNDLFRRNFRELFEHLEEQEVLKEAYVVKWFATLFAYSLPFETVKRLWDFILCQGLERTLVPLALGLIKLLSAKLMKCNGMEAQGLFQSLIDPEGPNQIRADDILRTAQAMLLAHGTELDEAEQKWREEEPEHYAELQRLRAGGCTGDVTPPGATRHKPVGFGVDNSDVPRAPETNGSDEEERDTSHAREQPSSSISNAAQHAGADPIFSGSRPGPSQDPARPVGDGGGVGREDGGFRAECLTDVVPDVDSEGRNGHSRGRSSSPVWRPAARAAPGRSLAEKRNHPNVTIQDPATFVSNTGADDDQVAQETHHVPVGPPAAAMTPSGRPPARHSGFSPRSSRTASQDNIMGSPRNRRDESTHTEAIPAADLEPPTREATSSSEAADGACRVSSLSRMSSPAPSPLAPAQGDVQGDDVQLTASIIELAASPLPWPAPAAFAGARASEGMTLPDHSAHKKDDENLRQI
mmetsp:Transcript_52775/g.140276  ORF Transcript_52775/g.140276 Transcript_52775/m.140276 type:complete len:705 (-) Transcript_52775:197-2311(-)